MNRLSFLDLRVPPVFLTLIVAAAMWGTAPVSLSGAAGSLVRSVLAASIASAGLIFGLLGVAAFRRARTSVNPLRPSNVTSFVATGPYRLSRNPMYVGLLFVLIGWAFFLAAPANVLWLVAFVVYLTRFQIIPEERVLHSIFGATYDSYRRSVRRWL
jgi:protein-S-isoprenylcysteine O-methyltransferase Ste14